MNLFLLFFYRLTFTVVIKLWIHQHWAIRTCPRTTNQHTSALFLLSVSTCSRTILNVCCWTIRSFLSEAGHIFFLFTHLPSAPGFRKCCDVGGRGVWRNGSGIQHKNPAWLDWWLARVYSCSRRHSTITFKSQSTGSIKHTHTRDSTDLSVRFFFVSFC